MIKNSAFNTDTSVEFCIKASVTDGAGVVYDWIGQKVRLDVEVNPVASFSSACETEVSITVYEGVSNAVSGGTSTTSLVVSAYRCDGGGNRVNGQLSQADDFFMCIEGDQNAAVIDVINTLTATKGVKAQELIVNEDIQDALKTFVYGLGTNKAIVSTRLSIDFFEDAEPIVMSGEAAVSPSGGLFGTNGRKLALRMLVDKEAPAEFNVLVGVNPLSQGPNDDGDKMKAHPKSSAAGGTQVLLATTTIAFAALATVWFGNN